MRSLPASCPESNTSLEMSGNRTSEGKHKRHGSWRSSPLLSRVSERFGSLRDKVPRPKNSFKKPSPTPVQPDTAYPKPSKPSFAECSAAVLAALDENYFTQDFDPLTHELSQLPNSVGQEELDVVVDKLASALEVVRMLGFGASCSTSLS